MEIVYLLSPGVSPDLHHAFDTPSRKFEMDSLSILSPNVACKNTRLIVILHGPVAISTPPPRQTIAQPSGEYEMKNLSVVIY